MGARVVVSECCFHSSIIEADLILHVCRKRVCSILGQGRSLSSSLLLRRTLKTKDELLELGKHVPCTYRGILLQATKEVVLSKPRISNINLYMSRMLHHGLHVANADDVRLSNTIFAMLALRALSGLDYAEPQGFQPLLARSFLTHAADCLKYLVVASSCGNV